MYTLLTKGLSVFHRVIVTLRYIRLAFVFVQYYGYLKLTVYASARLDAQYQPSHDVTIVSSTLGEEDGYDLAVRSWLQCDPKAVIIITIEKNLKHIKALLEAIGDDRIVLYTVPKPNYRQQMSKGIRATNTRLVVFADDDTHWSLQTLYYLTAPFEDASIGGVNVLQRVRKRDIQARCYTVWESYGALNQIRRSILHSALAYYNNGQVLNLSGMTVAYRTHILKQDEFFHAFTHDFWKGRYLLKTGDDNFLTSWIIQHGWKTYFQNHSDAVVTTTVNADVTYLKQVLRWSRDTARCYLRDFRYSLTTGRRQDYVRCGLNCAANYASDFALLLELGFLIVASISEAFHTRSAIKDLTGWSLARIWIDHLLISSTLQVLEHLPFFNTWYSLLYVPSTVLYMYIHAGVVFFGWLSLQKSVWGSRAGADDTSIDEDCKASKIERMIDEQNKSR